MDREGLVERGILKDPKVAPGLQGKLEELERRKKEDALKESLQSRPDQEALKQKGILQDAEEQ